MLIMDVMIMVGDWVVVQIDKNRDLLVGQLFGHTHVNKVEVRVYGLSPVPF